MGFPLTRGASSRKMMDNSGNSITCTSSSRRLNDSSNTLQFTPTTNSRRLDLSAGNNRWNALLVLIIVYWGGYYSGSLHCSYSVVDEIVTKRPNKSISVAPAAKSAQQDNARKRIKKKKPNKLRLPTPIMVVGLQKAGTTSIYGYFECGLDSAKLSHYDCKPNRRNPEKIGMACGKRMRRNLEKYKKPVFDGMDNFDLYAELDAQEMEGGMTLPQWKYLQEIHDQFPNSTWILNQRDEKSWLHSVDLWNDLRQRFIDHHIYPEFPRGVGAKDEEMFEFYRLQAKKIRDFVGKNPSHHLVEVKIDSPDAGQIMENAFGITKECWGRLNTNANTTNPPEP